MAREQSALPRLAADLAAHRGRLLFAFDLALIACAWIGAFGLPDHPLGWCSFALGPVLWAAMSEELYHPQRGAPIGSLRQALRGAGWVTAVVLAVWALADLPLWFGPTATRIVWPHLVFLWTSLVVTHTGARLAVCLIRRRGLDFKPAVVCGSGPEARELATYLKAHPGLGFALVDALPCEPSALPRLALNLPVRTVFLVKPAAAVRSVACSLAARTSLEVLEVLDAPTGPAVLPAADRPASEPAPAAPPPPRWIGSLAVAPLNSTPFHHLVFKRLTDIALALTLLVLLSPLLILIALAIALTSKGPVLFRQRRLALGGRAFTLYKFRTMVETDTPEQSIHTDPNDPRITLVGRLLRPIFLDELPQLLNVVIGDMSLVGPRPERSWAADRLEQEIEDYGLRLAVKPGLTGLAQVDGLHGNCDMKKRVERDLAYIAHGSFAVDLKILARTALKTGKHLIGAKS